MKTSLLMCASLAVLMFVATGCYEVVYTTEYKGDSCIKFEDAMYEVEPDVWVEACLGEDGAVEADYFYVELDGDVTDIEVSVKAGKCKETIDLVWDDIEEYWYGSACGFEIYADVYDSICEIGVLSDDIEGGKDGTAALSNVTFCFGDAIVVGPEEGDFPTDRAEEEDIYPEI
jgi:hypothetical protein